MTWREAMIALASKYGSAAAIARQAKADGLPGCPRSWQYWLDGERRPQPANRLRVIRWASAQTAQKGPIGTK